MKIKVNDVCGGEYAKIDIEIKKRESGESDVRAQAFVMSEDYFPGYITSLLCYEDVLIQMPV